MKVCFYLIPYPPEMFEKRTLIFFLAFYLFDRGWKYRLKGSWQKVCFSPEVEWKWQKNCTLEFHSNLSKYQFFPLLFPIFPLFFRRISWKPALLLVNQLICKLSSNPNGTAERFNFFAKILWRYYIPTNWQQKKIIDKL